MCQTSAARCVLPRSAHLCVFVGAAAAGQGGGSTERTACEWSSAPLSLQACHSPHQLPHSQNEATQARTNLRRRSSEPGHVRTHFRLNFRPRDSGVQSSSSRHHCGSGFCEGVTGQLSSVTVRDAPTQHTHSCQRDSLFPCALVLIHLH